MKTLEFIGLLCFVYMFVQGADAIQFIKRMFDLGNLDKPRKLWKIAVQKLINCSMCSGFWIGLIYYTLSGSTNPLLMACIVSIGSELFGLIYNWVAIKLQSFK